jgi:hypothetical protein
MNTSPASTFHPAQHVEPWLRGNYPPVPAQRRGTSPKNDPPGRTIPRPAILALRGLPQDFHKLAFLSGRYDAIAAQYI